MTSKTTGPPANENRIRKDDSQRQNRVAVLFLVLSFLMILILSIFLINDFANASTLGRLDVSIRADSRANYQPDLTKVVFPQINKNILRLVITEIPATGSPQDREETLVAVLLSPVPTMTPNAQNVATAAPTSTATENPTLTPSLTATLIPSLTPSPTRTLTPTGTRTNTSIVTGTITKTPTRTSSPSKTPTGTKTFTPTPTYTFTPSKTPSETPTLTFTPSYTPTPSETPTETPTPTDTATVTETPENTSTFTPTATYTNTPSDPVACNPSDIYYFSSPNIYFNGDELKADIKNNSSSAIRITKLHLDWQDAGSTKLDFIQLDGTDIWDSNGSPYDDDPPSSFAVSGAEFPWDSGNGARSIDAGGIIETLLINFDPDGDLLPAGEYTLRVTFGLSANCYIETSVTKP